MNHWHEVIMMVTIVFIAITVAYVIGKRIGFRAGKRMEAMERPILLRLETLETGKCPVCDRDVRGPHLQP